MDLSNDLVIRVRSDRVVVSKDDGESSSFGSAQSAQVRALVAQFGEGEPTLRSATLMASVAEARSVRPRQDPHPSAEHPVPTPPSVGDGIEIGPLAEAKIDICIDEVLRIRRSTRPSGRCNIAELATLLFHSARTVDEWASEDGARLAHRPYPSAGARHPIGITLVANKVEGLTEGAWVFDPVRCQLLPSPWDAETIRRVMEAATAALGGAAPSALLVAVADADRTLTRYPAGTAHLWRDAGAMLATAHLVAAATGLRSSIVGIGGQIGDETAHAIDVGAVALGH